MLELMASDLKNDIGCCAKDGEGKNSENQDRVE